MQKTQNNFRKNTPQKPSRFNSSQLKLRSSYSNNGIFRRSSNQFDDVGDYRIDRNKQLGKGFCSQVYQAVNKTTGDKVAIKLIKRRQIQSKTQKRFLQNEVRLLKILKGHANILQLKETIVTKQKFAIVTELCETSLSKLMRNSKNIKQPLPLEQAIKIIKQVGIGYYQMRKNELLHRDIKPANILIGMDGQARLADLGFAVPQKQLQEDKFVNVGSPLYMAPQVLKGNNYSQKAEMWAIGLVFLELLTGDVPWGRMKQSDLPEYYATLDLSNILLNVDQKWKNVVLKTVQVNVHKRIGISDFLECILDQKELTLLTTDDKNKTQIAPQTLVVQQFLVDQTETVASVKKIASQRLIKKQNPFSSSLQKLKKLTKKQEQNIINLKLQTNSSNFCATMKKQLTDQLHLCRIIYRLIELMIKGRDNIHFDCFDIESSFLKKLSDYIWYLFEVIKQVRIQYNIKDIAIFKKHQQYRQLIELVRKFQHNYQEYFQIAISHRPQSFLYPLQETISQLNFLQKRSKNHLKLIKQSVMECDITLITDQQICQFLNAVDLINTLIELLNTRKQGVINFSKVSKVQEAVKKTKLKHYTLKELLMIEHMTE